MSAKVNKTAKARAKAKTNAETLSFDQQLTESVRLYGCNEIQKNSALYDLMSKKNSLFNPEGDFTEHAKEMYTCITHTPSGSVTYENTPSNEFSAIIDESILIDEERELTKFKSTDGRKVNGAIITISAIHRFENSYSKLCDMVASGKATFGDAQLEVNGDCWLHGQMSIQLKPGSRMSIGQIANHLELKYGQVHFEPIAGEKFNPGGELYCSKDDQKGGMRLDCLQYVAVGVPRVHDKAKENGTRNNNAEIQAVMVEQIKDLAEDITITHAERKRRLLVVPHVNRFYAYAQELLNAFTPKVLPLEVNFTLRPLQQNIFDMVQEILTHKRSDPKWRCIVQISGGYGIGKSVLGAFFLNLLEIALDMDKIQTFMMPMAENRNSTDACRLLDHHGEHSRQCLVQGSLSSAKLHSGKPSVGGDFQQPLVPT